MRCEKQNVPCVIEPELRVLLETHVREYGTGGGVGDTLSATAVWRLTSDVGAETLGFAWLSEGKSDYMPRGQYVVIAVYPRLQGGGTGRAALRQIEKEAAKDLGLRELLAQVNNTDPQTGLRVRQWLLKEGYSVIREEDRYGEIPDDQYIVRNPMPLVFRKPLH